MEEAKLISITLVKEKLAACANILPGMTSVFWWEGEVQEGNEVVIIAKTTAALFSELEQRVKELHSYDCPCIVSLAVEGGSQEFLDWIEESVKD